MDWMEERRGEERGIGGRDSSTKTFKKGMQQNLPVTVHEQEAKTRFQK